mgnify:CR=1 FL=1
MTKSGPKTTAKLTVKPTSDQMNANTLPTSEKLRSIRNALPPEASGARVQLDRIIIEVEVLEDCRIAMNRTIKEGLYNKPPPPQPAAPEELVTQSTIDF